MLLVEDADGGGQAGQSGQGRCGRGRQTARRRDWMGHRGERLGRRAHLGTNYNRTNSGKYIPWHFCHKIEELTPVVVVVGARRVFKVKVKLARGLRAGGK